MTWLTINYNSHNECFQCTHYYLDKPLLYYVDGRSGGNKSAFIIIP